MTLNPNSGIGRAMLDAIMGLKTLGRIFVVCATTNKNYDDIQSVFAPDGTYGDVILFPNVASAVANTVSGRGDVVVVTPDAYTLTSMLTITQNRLKIVSLDYLFGNKQIRDQRTLINFAGTSGSSNIATLLLSGVNGFTSQGIKWLNSSTIAQSLACVVDEGSNGVFFDSCSIHAYGSAKLASTSGADLYLDGDGTEFLNCQIGTNTLQNTVANQVIYIPGLSGNMAHRVDIQDCIFEYYGNSASASFLNQSGGTSLDRYVSLHNSRFFNFKEGGGTTMTNAIIGAANPGGDILVTNCKFSNVTNIHTGGNIYVDSASGILS